MTPQNGLIRPNSFAASIVDAVAVAAKAAKAGDLTRSALRCVECLGDKCLSRMSWEPKLIAELPREGQIRDATQNIGLNGADACHALYRPCSLPCEPYISY
jgi:hypothetical protein